MVDYQPLQSRSNSMFDSDSIDPLALTSPTPRRAMTMSISGPSLGAGLGSGVADMASSVRDPTVVWPMTSAGAENTMLWSVYGNDATAVHDNNMWALNMMQQQSQDGQGSADGAEHSSFTDATAHYTFQQPSHHPQTVSPHDLSHNELTEYPGLAADGSMIHNSHMMLDPSAGHTANPYENNGIGSINGPLAHHFINPAQTQHVMTQAPQLVAAPAPTSNDQQQRRRQPRAPSSSMRHMHSLPVMSSRKQRPNRSESPGSGSGAPGSGSGAHGHGHGPGHGPAPGHSRTLSGSASIPPHAIRKKRSVSRTLARSASNGSIDFGGSSAGMAMSVSMNQLASANVPTAGAGTMSHNVQNMQNVQAVQAVQNVQSVQNTINTHDGYNGLLSQQSSQSSHSGYSVQNGHHSSNSHDQSNNSSQSSSSNSSSDTTTGGISFMNYTPKDGHILMTGVAPSGSSKTKAKREREAIERQRRLSEAARRAVMAAGGDPGQIEGWIKVSDDESPPAAAEVHIKSPDPDSESEGK
ncbi:Regulatory protein wetA [Ceratocystis platani]|uniref:Regulatory protein wetA n=1 Tax=Ceratocystis fimbriata f. sp. platani TaxID=88771 RepID=A0A0F8BTF1_CERFI|nr:Regulatory protein wetA [Ceratocystis platani]